MSELPVFKMTDTVCQNPKCRQPVLKRVSMADGRGGQLAKGMIMICSTCLHAMILGDTDWRPLTRADYEALPRASQQKLVMVAKGLEGLLKEGKEWTPYGTIRKPSST